MQTMAPGVMANGIKLIMNAILDFKEGFRTVLKKRPGNDRLCIILLIIAFLLEMFTNYQWTNLFMYYRLKLEFRMEDFSLYMSLAGMVGLSGQYIFVPLFIKGLKFHDATISVIGKKLNFAKEKVKFSNKNYISALYKTLIVTIFLIFTTSAITFQMH